MNTTLQKKYDLALSHLATCHELLAQVREELGGTEQPVGRIVVREEPNPDKPFVSKETKETAE